MAHNVLINQLEQNWRNYSPGIKVRRPLGGKIRKMGAKRIGVLPNLLNTNRKMTFGNYLSTTANFTSPQLLSTSTVPLHPFQYMSYVDLQRLSPEEFEALQTRYQAMQNSSPEINKNRLNKTYVDPEVRRRLQEQRKQRELGLAGIREARGWANTSTSVLREARGTVKTLGLDKELQRRIRRSLGIGNE